MSGFVELKADDAVILKRLITKWCGIVIDHKGTVMLEFRMHPILKKYGCPDYKTLIRMALGMDPQLRDDLIDAVTTNETLWFRDPNLYDCLLNTILPGAITKARAEGRKGLRIWSAAASTGQESYSIAMLLHEIASRGQLSSVELANCSIHGTDISGGALRVARNATYDVISMGRGMLPGFEAKYFNKNGRSFTMRPDIRRMVKFEQRNLLDRFGSLGNFDIVLIRNVLIYFSPEVKKDILNRIGRNLQASGTLIVGSCEDASRFSKSFSVFRSGRTMYFEVNKAS
jgi:chemotaxis protein methyltransferase CheR